MLFSRDLTAYTVLHVHLLSPPLQNNGSCTPALSLSTPHGAPAVVTPPGPRRGVLWTEAAPASVQRWVSSAAVFGERDATPALWQRRVITASVWTRASSAASANGQREATE